MNYTLNQLQIFLKITQTKSITKAAEELHLTQPAVSIQLKNFQDQFDLALTEVIGRQLYVTEFGKEISNLAENILEQVNAINHKTLAYKGQLSGTLKISIVSTAKYIFPYFISDFIKLHPGIDLHIDVTNKTSVLESLTNNEVDFSLVSILPTNINYEKLDILKNKLYLVGNNEVKLDSKKDIKEIFGELPLIFREKGSGTRQVMEKFININNINVNKKMELTSNEAVKQAVIAGLGCSILPIIGIKNQLQNKELKIIPVKGLPIETTWSLVWLKGKKHTFIVDKLLNYIKLEKQNIVKNKFDWYEKY